MGGAELRSAAQALARLVVAVIVCLTGASLLPVAAGWRSYVVLSGSMAPSLWVGDVVVAAPARTGDLTPGRIVVFTEPGRPDHTVVHRIQGRRPDGSLITKGDANATADSTPLSASDVRGLVRLRLPLIALPAFWWRTGAWSPLVAAGVLLLALIAMAGPATAGPDRAPAGRRRRHRRAGPSPVQHRYINHGVPGADLSAEVEGRGEHDAGTVATRVRHHPRHARRRGVGPFRDHRSRLDQPGDAPYVRTDLDRAHR